jgi:hypothetical protein
MPLGPTPRPTELAAVEPPKHPLHAMTTYELTYYRRRLENALAYLGKQDPVPAIRTAIQTAALLADPRTDDDSPPSPQPAPTPCHIWDPPLLRGFLPTMMGGPG